MVAVVVPVIAPEVAVIVAVPVATPVRSPEEFTVATLESEVVQVAPPLMFLVLPSS